MKIFKISVILLLSVICSEEVLGTTGKRHSKWEIGANFIGALVLWKALPNVTRTKYCEHSERWEGMSNGLAWYPIIKGNWKIGFFCLEHRTWEIIPKIVHLNLVKVDHFWLYLLLTPVFPSSFSLISLKYKMLRLNFLSLLEALNYCINVHDIAFSGVTSPLIEFFSPFFKQGVYDYFQKSFLTLILFIFPRLSIDLSYSSNEDEEDKSGEDLINL